MTSVGETLRRERLQRGLELEQISRELRISARFLGAIEDDDFKKLPGGVFAKSFVRQYARLLGLDEEELASEVQRLVEPESVVPAQTSQTTRSTAPEIHLPRVEEWEMGSEKRFSWSSSLPALALVVVVMLVCSGIYSWWQRARHQVSAHESPPPVLQPVETPAPQAATAPQPVPAQQDPGAQAPAIPTPTTETAAAPPVERSAARPAETNSADRPAPEAPSGPAPAAPAALPAIVPAVRQGDLASAPPVTPPVRTGPVKLELTAAEPVWVLAQANGKYLFSGTLDANQTRTVEATGTVVLRLGNAGGLNITLNGKPLGTVGPKGQVRTVQFTSGGFQIVAAPKPSLVDPL